MLSHGAQTISLRPSGRRVLPLSERLIGYSQSLLAFAARIVVAPSLRRVSLAAKLGS